MKKTLAIIALCIAALTAAAQSPADSLKIVSAHWTQLPMDKGLSARTATFDTLYSVPQRIAIVEVDTSLYRIDVAAMNPRLTTSKAAADAQAVAAINGTFFNMKAHNSVCYICTNGVVSDTTETNMLNLTNGAYTIDQKGANIDYWDITTESKLAPQKDFSAMVSGPMLVTECAEVDLADRRKQFCEARHPRSAIAIMNDGKIWLVVVDGRQKGSAEGISLPQLAHLLRVMGAKTAMNLDGGGSSTLWTQPHGVINVVSGSIERAVANALFVVPKKH